MTTVAVVTIVAGRRSHLARQALGLTRQDRLADHLVVVRMDAAPVDLPAGVAHHVDVLDALASDAGLPLAAARNLGTCAVDADVVVLLDVDCIPGAGLVGAYACAAEVDGLVCGMVRYLPEGSPGAGDWTEADLWAASSPHPARPAPRRLQRLDRFELAWTTSLAMRRDVFDRIGGFDERFVGYGGEDTDFAFRAKDAGLGVWWSADAIAYHQHHPGAQPPVDRVEDVVRNANLFASVHGWYPMHGWLEQFRTLGLVDFRPDAGVLRLVGSSPP